MAEPEIRGLWRARLRWRLRGATMWPAFGLAVVADAVLLHELPIAGDSAPGVVGALLLATFFNLLVVAVGAPLAGMWLRRRRRDLPRMIADDRAGTVLLALVALVLAGLGVLHRPAMESARNAFASQAAAVRLWVATQAPPDYRANIDRADTWKQGPNLYRTCVPGRDPHRALCLIVFTDQHPPAVQRDPDERPNAVAAGPDFSPSR
jgi:hypothetical protein